MSLPTHFPFRGEVVWLTPDQGGRTKGQAPDPGGYVLTAHVPPETAESAGAGFVLRSFDPRSWRSPAEGAWRRVENRGANRICPGSLVVLTEDGVEVAHFLVEKAPLRRDDDRDDDLDDQLDEDRDDDLDDLDDQLDEDRLDEFASPEPEPQPEPSVVQDREAEPERLIRPDSEFLIEPEPEPEPDYFVPPEPEPAPEPEPVRLRAIGFWASPQYQELPDPADLVDDTWDEDERSDVVWHLYGAHLRSWSTETTPCRFCDTAIGSKTFTDGTYVWPEGLAHYVADHGVRLPSEFVDHVRSHLSHLDDAELDVEWWLASGERDPLA